MAFRVKYALIIGIMIVSITSWPYVLLLVLPTSSDKHAAAALPSPSSLMMQMETTDTNSSSKSLLGIPSRKLSTHLTGTLVAQPPILPSLCSHFSMSTSSMRLPLSTPWFVSVVSSTLATATFLVLLLHTALMLPSSPLVPCWEVLPLPLSSRAVQVLPRVEELD